MGTNKKALPALTSGAVGIYGVPKMSRNERLAQRADEALTPESVSTDGQIYFSPLKKSVNTQAAPAVYISQFRGEPVEARVLGYDPYRDLALIVLADGTEQTVPGCKLGSKYDAVRGVHGVGWQLRAMYRLIEEKRYRLTVGSGVTLDPETFGRRG